MDSCCTVAQGKIQILFLFSAVRIHKRQNQLKERWETSVALFLFWFEDMLAEAARCMYVCMYVYTTIYFSRLLQLFLTDSYPLLLFNINTALNTDMVLSWNAIRKAGLEGDVASSWLLHIKIPSHTASTDVLLVHWFLFVVRKCTLSLKRDPHPQPTLISKTQWRVQNLVKFV